MIQRHRPRLLWISLPCGPYSPILSLFNENTEEQLAKSLDRKRKARKLIRNGIKAARLQVDLGGDVAWEWPGNNGGWHLPEMRAFLFLDWMEAHFGLSVARRLRLWTFEQPRCLSEDALEDCYLQPFTGDRPESSW